MSACPELEQLWSAALAAEVDAHVRTCDGCQAVRDLARARRASAPIEGGSPSLAAIGDAVCIRFEPIVAALADDGARAVDEATQRELALHLAACTACNELVARMTAARPHLDEVPEPALRGAGELARAAVTTVGLAVGRPRSSWLGRLVPPAPHRPAWVVELGLAAAVAATLTYALMRRPASPPAVAESAPAVVAPTAEVPAQSRAAGGVTGDAEERARQAEARITEAERRVRELEERLARLEPAPKSSADGAPAKPRSRDSEGRAVDPFSKETATTPGTSQPASPPGDGAPGFLTIVCSPFCEHVVDGGKDLGPSPVVRAPVAPGTHRITLKSAHDTKHLSVVVVSGQVSTLRVKMDDGPDKPPGPALF